MQHATTTAAMSRALGEELRRTREAANWSRTAFVAQLPSGIGERTLLSYEHGTRQMTVVRLVELCRVLGVGAPELVGQALQRARIHLDNLALRVDLRALLQDTTLTFRPMAQWARVRLNAAPDGVVEVTPAAVRDLAAFIDRTPADLAAYLTRFMPELEPAVRAEVVRPH